MDPMTDLMQDLSKDRFFSRFDFSKGFWQIPVAEEDVRKTTFATQDG